MAAKPAPWPIEAHLHPLASLPLQRAALSDALEALLAPLHPNFRAALLSILTAEDTEVNLDVDPDDLLRVCFQLPQFFRDLVLRHVRIPPRESFRGKGTFYVWLNKACPVGCGFCFFSSPSKAQTEIPSGDEGVGKLIRFINDGHMERLFISGGGEPMLNRDDVNHIAREVDVDRMIIVTSAFFAATCSGARKAVTELRLSLAANPHNPSVTLRLSLDSGHLEKLGSRERGFTYVYNLIGALQETSTGEDDRLSFLIHTIAGDATVERLLAELPVQSREESGPEFKRRTRVVLTSGYTFIIEYAQLFQSNTDIDMNGPEAEHNIAAFEDYVTHRAGGNMTLSHNAHSDQQVSDKGVDWLVFYDGRATHWSSTVPDNEPSIYTHTFDEAMQQHLDDVISLALLEKGTFYRDQIVAEVNPKAVARARAVGLRDQYPRVLLEEETTRLYVSLRVIQDFIAEGRITAEQMEQWPQVLQMLVSTNPATLAEMCRASKHDILNQYLVDLQLTIEKLQALYKMIRLGHYEITPLQMIERVLRSRISEDLKSEFVGCVWGCRHAAPLVSQFQTPRHMVFSFAAIQSNAEVVA